MSAPGRASCMAPVVTDTPFARAEGPCLRPMPCDRHPAPDRAEGASRHSVAIEGITLEHDLSGGSWDIVVKATIAGQEREVIRELSRTPDHASCAGLISHHVTALGMFSDESPAPPAPAPALGPLAEAMSPTPWRVGSKVPRNLYDAHGRDIGRMDSAVDAAAVVAAVNALPAALHGHDLVLSLTEKRAGGSR